MKHKGCGGELEAREDCVFLDLRCKKCGAENLSMSQVEPTSLPKVPPEMLQAFKEGHGPQRFGNFDAEYERGLRHVLQWLVEHPRVPDDEQWCELRQFMGAAGPAHWTADDFRRLFARWGVMMFEESNPAHRRGLFHDDYCTSALVCSCGFAVTYDDGDDEAALRRFAAEHAKAER